jgi:alkanesulfonate monooxygenase SsuD/methylene tetrahydromethanopterin reductase-like flavin-dependent oxidoreductase (luciferase family)
LPLVARYAAEWNAVFVPPARFSDLSSRLDELLVAEGRRPEEARRSLMTGALFARNQAELDSKLPPGRTAAELQERGMVVGAPAQFKEQLDQFAAAGVQGIMLQWLDLDDIDRLEAMAATVI